ncbi:VRR-NUC domain-containing protein [Clostridium sp. DSM 100503]|jgi:Holliday junction resolvase|uniref:VRR-NUC domain-containing protein n=1 Tax=Clostridium sp. DSM 100503 TaxID=2963282 RepID=UPI002149AB9C|nr:VRR-NUC domain-containing protein [Clostridium sp. DSM 100503]MCR1953044.1 VRR-NUC domain-containing protein [Clostridium sp. DSM 100503]
MAAEKTFENEIKKFLNKLPNTWYFKVWSGPYSKSGIPDIIACINGHFVALEVKAENGHASELQKRNIRLINESNGIAYIVYPKDFENLKERLIELCRS